MKKIIKYVLLILTISASLMFYACNNNNEDTAYIELNKTQATLTIDLEDKLSYKVYGNIDSEEVAKWSVENPDILSVDERGGIKGKRVGTTIVTCQLGTYTDTCEVTVNTGSYIPTLYLSNLEGDSCKVLAGTNLDFGAYVLYAGKNYTDLKIEYELSTNDFGKFNANRFFANNNKGTIEVTATAEWRGVTSEFLTKTFTIEVIDNVVISVANIVDKLTVYTCDSHMGNSYNTFTYFDVSVIENGANIAVNTDNLAVVVKDQTLAQYSQAEGKIFANKMGMAGKTEVEITYTSTSGDEFTASYQISVDRPVYDTKKSVGYFSASTDKIDYLSFINEDETLEEAVQYNFDGSVTELEVKNGKILGYKYLSSGVNTSEILLYTKKVVDGDVRTVGYKLKADVYGYLIRKADDISALSSITDRGKLSIAVTNNIDASGKVFPNISNFSGSFNGLGHTISNVTVGANGLFGKFANGEFCNVAFVNVRLPESGQAVVIGGSSGKANEGSIHDVYITVNEQDIIKRNYRNFAIFYAFMFNVKVSNVVVEYPSMPMTVSKDIDANVRYGLFYTESDFNNIGVLGALNYKGLYVISTSDGSPAPLLIGRGSQFKIHGVDDSGNGTPNGNIDDGIFQYLVYANNDIASQVKTSSAIKNTSTNIKYKYNTESGKEGVGVNATEGNLVDAYKYLYYITPQYEIISVNGKLELVPVNTYTPVDIIPKKEGDKVFKEGDKVFKCGSCDSFVFDKEVPTECPNCKKEGESLNLVEYSSAWVTSNGKKTSAADFSTLDGRFGVMVMGSGIVRYDSYYDFIVNNVSTASFNDSWNIEYGYPLWKETLINEVGITANGNSVSRIELIYDKDDISRISAEIGLDTGDYELDAEPKYSIVFGKNVISLDGNKITALSAGTAYIRVDFVVDNTSYSKYVEVFVSLAEGEFIYDKQDKLYLSAFDGKLYKRDENGDFIHVGLEEVFGVDVNLSSALLSGSKVAISADKQYVTGAKVVGNDINADKELRLTSGKTSYTIKIDLYGGILSTAEDLKKVFNIDTFTEKVQGYYTLANDIVYDSINYPIHHVDGESSDLKKGGFMGVLDGNGCAIDGFIMENDGTSGLFGYVGRNVEIKNIAFTNVGVTNTEGAEYDTAATLFGWEASSGFKLTNVRIEFNESILTFDYAYGLLYTIVRGYKFTNVIVESPSPSGYCGLNYFGRGLFSSMESLIPDFGVYAGTESDVASNYVFNNVYIISKPAANGKVYLINDQVLPYYCDPSNRAQRIYVAGNDYTDIINGKIESEGGFEQLQNGTGKNKYFSSNPVIVDYSGVSGAITQNPSTGRVEVGRLSNTAILWHVRTILRYDTAEAMANAGVTKVGNWKVSADGVVWER